MTDPRDPLPDPDVPKPKRTNNKALRPGTGQGHRTDLEGGTSKQRRLVAAYLSNGGNAAAAARVAGYGGPAAQMGHKMLKSAGAKAILAGGVEQIARVRPEISPEQVVDMLLEDRQDAKAADQHGPAVRATELLGKTFGMFVDRSQSVEVRLSDGDLISRLTQGDPEAERAARLLLGRGGFEPETGPEPAAAFPDSEQGEGENATKSST